MTQFKQTNIAYFPVHASQTPAMTIIAATTESTICEDSRHFSSVSYKWVSWYHAIVFLCASLFLLLTTSLTSRSWQTDSRFLQSVFFNAGDADVILKSQLKEVQGNGSDNTKRADNCLLKNPVPDVYISSAWRKSGSLATLMEGKGYLWYFFFGRCDHYVITWPC